MADRYVDFFPSKKRGVKLLHIECPGCIVNIRVNLTNMEGEQVTSIEIIPDHFSGEEWHLAEDCKDVPHNIRLIEGKAKDAASSDL